MINNKKILAIIPARAGSKGLVSKNKKKLAKKPLISYSIEAAINCEYIDCVYVSTDDSEILEIANEYNIYKSEIRPSELAQDTTSTTDVIKFTLELLKTKKQNFDIVLLLQPTSPLRTAEDISKALENYSEKKYKSLVSVTEVEHSPLWSNTLPDDLSLNSFIDDKIKNIPRQKLPKYYRLNGAIYIADVNYFNDNNGFLGDDSFAFVMPQNRSIDIDNELDFEIAEILMKQKQERNGT